MCGDCMTCKYFNPTYRECEIKKGGEPYKNAYHKCKLYTEADEKAKVNILKRMYVPFVPRNETV